MPLLSLSLLIAFGTTAVSIAAIVLLFLVPSYYKDASRERHLFKAYERLKPYQQLIAVRDSKLVSDGYAADLCNYLGNGMAHCNPVEYSEIRAAAGKSLRVADALDRASVSLVYVNESV